MKKNTPRSATLPLPFVSNEGIEGRESRESRETTNLQTSN